MSHGKGTAVCFLRRFIHVVVWTDVLHDVKSGLRLPFRPTHLWAFLGVIKLMLTQILYAAISRKVVGKSIHATFWKAIWDMISTRHCSCWNFYCCFPLAFANIRPWPLVPLKNKELKTTHNTFRGCRVHFFRQPFSKGLYKSWRHKLLKPNIDFLKLF